jgi:uncharacterized protein involved in exopolysaccharide biosynthesis
MATKATKREMASETQIDIGDLLPDEESLRVTREKTANRVRLLWNERKFLGRAAAIGLVMATLIAFLIPRHFTSTARLMPPDQNSGRGAAILGALQGTVGTNISSMAENVLGMKTDGDLFVGILKSDTVRDDLIHKFNLQRVYHDRYMEDCRDDLDSHTRISADSKSGIISVSVVDHDPRRSAAMAQEYVTELNWVVAHVSTSSAHRERVFLDQRLADVKRDLEASEKQFSQFASEKGAIDIPSQGRAMLASAAEVQGELIAAESELQGFRQIYTDNNARVKSLEARVDELRSALQKLGGANANETSSAGDLYPTLRQLPLLGVTYADLLRRTRVEVAIFETLTQEDELAKVQEAKEIPSVSLLDAPQVPDEKSFPPRLLIASLGVLLGLCFGISWIIARESWMTGDPTDVRRIVAVQVWRDIQASLPWTAKNGHADVEYRPQDSQAESFQRNSRSASESFESRRRSADSGVERQDKSGGPGRE